jgi:hypothetical protein
LSLQLKGSSVEIPNQYHEPVEFPELIMGNLWLHFLNVLTSWFDNLQEFQTQSYAPMTYEISQNLG